MAEMNDAEHQAVDWIGHVREIGAIYGHDLTDEAIDFLLYEKTSYPFGSLEQVDQQLHFELSQRHMHYRKAPQ